MPRRKNLVVSVTEIQSFQSCRRRFRLAREYEARSLAPNLWFGGGIHFALEHYYRYLKEFPEDGLEGASQNMQAAFTHWLGLEYQKLANVFGSLWKDAKPALEQMAAVGRKMLENYPAYDRQAEIRFFPRIVEKRVYLPMGRGNFLTARLDLVANVGTPDGPLGVVDHKTASQRSNTGRALDLDEQGTGYSYTIYRVAGEVAEFILNTLMKAAPEPPRIVQDKRKGHVDKLSSAKDQNTTYDLYLSVIRERGEKVQDYADILGVLAERGWDHFYYREVSPRNLAQLEAYEGRVRIIMEEIRRVFTHEEYAYPSPSPFKCPTCPFQQVCLTMEDGGDYQQILDTSFTRVSKSPWETPKRSRKETALEEA